MDFIGNVTVHESFEDRNMINLLCFAAFFHGIQKNLCQVFESFHDVKIDWLKNLGEKGKPFDNSC